MPFLAVAAFFAYENVQVLRGVKPYDGKTYENLLRFFIEDVVPPQALLAIQQAGFVHLYPSSQYDYSTKTDWTKLLLWLVVYDLLQTMLHYLLHHLPALHIIHHRSLHHDVRHPTTADAGRAKNVSDGAPDYSKTEYAFIALLP